MQERFYKIQVKLSWTTLMNHFIALDNNLSDVQPIEMFKKKF